MAEGKAGFHNRSILDRASLNTSRKLENESSPLAQPPIQPFLVCPQCGSNRLYKDGLRYLSDGTSIQRWLCRECYYRFSEKKPLQKKPSWQINTASALFSKRQVCELLTRESKNLAEVARQETALREGTKQAPDVKGKIIEFLWHLERENKRSKTIVTYRKYLTRLANIGANLFDPESVKDAIALQKSMGRELQKNGNRGIQKLRSLQQRAF